MLEKLPPDQLVDLLWDKTRRNQVVTALVGGLTATELRRVTLTPGTKAALVRGLKHPNS
ncbi:MAG: hypothetical protein JNM70_25315, partial [Anaerolineae bacterium]|nr:hypothetical protein [Anaerolineae bacterium]